MPRPTGQHIYHVHIADGFSNDCDELVHRCLQLETLDFHSFCEIWKEMNFDMLYQGRTSAAEIAELSEELIHIAKHYMVKDTSSYDESVVGLFLVYGLISLQPFSGFALLRIVPEDVRAINRIEVVARRERRLDILYILGELLIKWTQYHAAERPRGMESVLRKYLEGYTSIDKLGVRPIGVFYRQNEELDMMRDLGIMTRQYTVAKNRIMGGDSPPDPSLKYINENLPNDLSLSLKNIVNGMIDDVDYADHEDDDTDNDLSADEEKISIERSSIVQAIKLKAMTNAVDPMKHLTATENRKKSATSPHKTDLKNTTGKVKRSNHTKIVTTSPKKRKTDERSPVKKKNQKNASPVKEHTGDDSGGADLKLEEFQKQGAWCEVLLDDKNKHETKKRKSNKGKRKQPESEKKEQCNEAQVTGGIPIDIRIQSLPLLMRTEAGGREVEIEFIDLAKPSVSKESDKGFSENDTKEQKIDQSDTSSDEETIPDMIVKSNNDGALKTYKKRNDTEEQCETFENTFPSKKKDRMNLKRRDLKSKFKRMGMLPVANFKDQNET